MPHGSLKIIPGVDTNKTPALNEAAVSKSNLIRFFPDRNNLGLAQKLGGWTKYINYNNFPNVIRSLKAWQDLELSNWLAIGCEGSNGLFVYNATDQSTPQNITPTNYENSFFPNGTTLGISTTAGSNFLTVFTTVNVTSNDFVYFPTYVAVGNLLLYGAYDIVTSGSGQYTINANANVIIGTISAVPLGGSDRTVTVFFQFPHNFSIGQTVYTTGVVDTSFNSSVTKNVITAITESSISYVQFGNNSAANSFGGVVTPAYDYAGSPPLFNLPSGNSLVTVTLNNHPFFAGDTFNVIVPTDVGGITLSGLYTVVNRISNNTFTISAQQIAKTSEFTGSISGTTLTVSAVTTGTNYVTNPVKPGMIITGAGIAANTIVVSQTSGTTGGVGSYTVSVSQTVSSTTITSNSIYENGGQILEEFFISSVALSSGPNILYGGDGSPTAVYGADVYSSGDVSTGITGIPVTATDWSLDNWGQILMANPTGGTIYYWSPVGSAVLNASYVPNAPLFNEGIFVAMPQRQLIAYGSTSTTFQDPLLVRWSDVEDFTVWTAQANNQAGSYRIPTGTRIVGGMQVAQQALLWTDLDLWAMQYVGGLNVYGFNKIGSNAGLIARKAMAQLGGVTYWMGQKQFFRLAGSGPEVIPCPVWDQIFQNIYVSPVTGEVDANGKPWTDRIRCAPNTQFNEVSWHFPAAKIPVYDENGEPTDQWTDGNGEVNAYVKYNIALNQWDYAYQNPDHAQNVLVGRTAWIDQSVIGPPVAAATRGSIPAELEFSYVYQHETSNDADGEPINASFQTGYFALTEGDEQIFVDQVWPDMKWGTTSGDQDAKVNITFYVTNYPTDPPQVFGPYEMTESVQYLSVRMRGRLLSIGVSSKINDPVQPGDLDTFWRLGNIRYRFQQDGKY